MSNFSRYLSKNWLDDPKSNILSGLVVAFAMIPEAIAFSGIAGVAVSYTHLTLPTNREV